MELIKPAEISSKIMTLIEESEKKLIIISPYVKIGKWYKLKNKIKQANRSHINIEFYIREDSENEHSKREVTELGIDPILVPDLHCKLYLNESYAIITSMNLLLSSEINSLEIGYKTENKKEYDEILGFYSKYIACHRKKIKEECKNESYDHWLDLIYDNLRKDCKRLNITIKDQGVVIETGINTYEIFIYSCGFGNKLRVSGILSSKQFEVLKSEDNKIESEIGLIISLQEGKEGYYDLVWGESRETFAGRSINEMAKEEYGKISQLVDNFIRIVDKRKAEIR